MLKKWEKFENSLNDKLVRLIEAIKAFVLSISPKVFFKIKNRFVEKYYDIHSTIKNRIVDIFLDTKDSATYKKDKFFNTLTDLQEYPYKEKLGENLISIKKNIKRPPSHFTGKLKEFFKKQFLRIKAIYDKYGPAQISVTILAVAIFLIGLNLMIYSSSTMWFSESSEREVLTEVERLKRPDYYNLSKKTFIVLNIKVPVYIDNINSISAVTIDFGVETSNRFATLYLTENEHKLKDHFFMTMEPIKSSFPIESEGKDVIREKIQIELNEFLKKHNVEGTVKEVTIMYIIAT